MLVLSRKPGEKLVIYHSNVGKAAVGTAKVVSVDATNPKDPKVRIQPVKPLKLLRQAHLNCLHTQLAQGFDMLTKRPLQSQNPYFEF